MPLDREYYVIFGAAVRPDGTPSGTLRRRVLGAFATSEGAKDKVFIASGGIGESGYSEAEVMKKMLIELGIKPSQIICDEKSTDTLDSIINTREIIRSRGNDSRVYVCSSPYHIPRCRILYSIAGMSTRPAKIDSDLPTLGLWKWIFYLVREAGTIRLTYQA